MSGNNLLPLAIGSAVTVASVWVLTRKPPDAGGSSGKTPPASPVPPVPPPEPATQSPGINPGAVVQSSGQMVNAEEAVRQWLEQTMGTSVAPDHQTVCDLATHAVAFMGSYMQIPNYVREYAQSCG